MLMKASRAFTIARAGLSLEKLVLMFMFDCRNKYHIYSVCVVGGTLNLFFVSNSTVDYYQYNICGRLIYFFHCENYDLDPIFQIL